MAAKHILACVDFSEQSTRALDEVGEYARANGSKVTLIHIADPQAFIPPQAVVEPQSATDETAHAAELATLRDRHLSDLEVDIAIVAFVPPIMVDPMGVVRVVTETMHGVGKPVYIDQKSVV